MTLKRWRNILSHNFPPAVEGSRESENLTVFAIISFK
jgi:hypothetical protein